MVELNQEDVDDLKTVLQEQLESIQKLKPLIHEGLPNDLHFVYDDILECNKVMKEIVCGPTGGIIKVV